MDKQRILGEIPRTAEANGSVPLGQRRFYQETRIKDSDWQGKIWARWGDAVRDAGFQPNRLQEAYPEEVLIEKFVGLIRELGRYPVAAEIRLKARNDDRFPSHNTFSRFGSKSRSKIIVNFCRAVAASVELTPSAGMQVRFG